LNFYEYIEKEIDEITEAMLSPANKKLEKIPLLIITLILKIAVKEGIKLKK
jgi:hypothetical protein